MSVKKFAPNDWFKDSEGRTVHDVTVQVQIKTQRISVVTNPTPLPTNSLTNRQFVRIMNVGNSVMYIGGADVTTTNGWPIYPLAVETIAIEDTAIVYGISDSSVDVIVMEGL